VMEQLQALFRSMVLKFSLELKISP